MSKSSVDISGELDKINKKLDQILDGMQTPKSVTTDKSKSTRPPAQTANFPCPDCKGPMWDNTTFKLYPKAPDYACKNKMGCGKGIWGEPPIMPEEEDELPPEAFNNTWPEYENDIENDEDDLPF